MALLQQSVRKLCSVDGAGITCDPHTATFSTVKPAVTLEQQVRPFKWENMSTTASGAVLAKSCRIHNLFLSFKKRKRFVCDPMMIV